MIYEIEIYTQSNDAPIRSHICVLKSEHILQLMNEWTQNDYLQLEDYQSGHVILLPFSSVQKIKAIPQETEYALKARQKQKRYFE